MRLSRLHKIIKREKVLFIIGAVAFVFMYFYSFDSAALQSGTETDNTEPNISSIEETYSDTKKEDDNELTSDDLSLNENIMLLSTTQIPGLSYRSAFKTRGWCSWTGNDSINGKIESGEGITALQISIENIGLTGTIEYRMYSKREGWNAWNGSGIVNGKTDGTNAAELLQIRLTGQMNENYDIYYRVYISQVGWLNWGSNSSVAGSFNGDSYIEAVQIKITRKGEQVTESTKNSFIGVPKISYRKNIQGNWYSWTSSLSDMIIEIPNEKISALQLDLQNTGLTGSIYYRVYVQGEGWTSLSGSGGICGANEQTVEITDIQCYFTGQLAQYYDVYYCVNTGNVTWENWKKNGESAGIGDLAIKDFKIRVVEKGEPSPEKLIKIPRISYRTYVDKKAWQNWESNGAPSGIVEQGYWLEALQLDLENLKITGTIKYRTAIRGIGWSAWSGSGLINGEINKGKPIEIVQMCLTGRLGELYDLYYRVYLENVGWLGWAKNGESAGSEGQNKAIEAIQVTIVGKGESAPGGTKGAYVYNPGMSYRVSTQEDGWKSWVSDGMISCGVDSSNSINALQLNLENIGISGTIKYRICNQNSDWSEWKSSGQISELGGESYIQAVEIKFNGQLEKCFDVYYQVYIDNVGWMDWTKNGGTAGNDLGLSIGGIRIKIVSQCSSAPGEMGRAFIAIPELEYRSYMKENGWGKWMISDAVSGVTGETGTIEAIQLSLENLGLTGTIQFRTYTESGGWQAWSGSGSINGIVGSGLGIEAIQIRLTGQLSEFFDIYYRVNSEDYGWLDWAKNGGESGTEGYNKRIYSYQIKIVKKNQSAPGAIDNAFKKALLWGIDVSAHQGVINWPKVKAAGVDFAMLRLTQWDREAQADALIEIKEDVYLMNNIIGTLQNDIKIGGYVYNYATTPLEAAAEAEYAISILKKYNVKLDYPIAFDLEEDSQMTSLQKANNMAMAAAFCGTLEKAGYKVMVYGSPNKLKNYFDYPSLSSEYEIWLARYRWGDSVIVEFEDFSKRQEMYELGYEGGNWNDLTNVKMWQYTQVGRISGINGNVDFDMCFKQY